MATPISLSILSFKFVSSAEKYWEKLLQAGQLSKIMSAFVKLVFDAKTLLPDNGNGTVANLFYIY